MHHPGPPRFLAVGESVQLAPRDPDPEATYEWQIRSAPAISTIEVPAEKPVIEFTPDAPGTYELRLETPERTHSLTVRAFPGEKSIARSGGGASGESGWSGGRSGSARPHQRSGDVPVSGSGTRPEDGGGGRPRIQLRGTVEGDDLVVRADPLSHPDTGDEELDVEFLIDDRDDVDERDVTIDGRVLRIPTAAVGDRVRIHGVAVGDTYSVPDTIEFTRAVLPDGTASESGTGAASQQPFEVRRPNDPPEWATDITVYEIYVRGFTGDEEMAESDQRGGSEADRASATDAEDQSVGGGDPSVFEELTERLDYLEDLGVDCLWLTPVLENDHAPHGYNIVDFFSIAADLGDREDYEAFVDAAHDRGMAVLFDLVLNHSARDHPFFQDAYGNPDSEYYEWYDWQDSGEPETYFDWEYIANWNFENLAVRRHLLDAVDTWFEVADGFRCDMAWAVPDTFWQELRDRVKARDSEFLLLDETIPYVADFHNGMFDVHFDTTLYFTLRQVGRGHAPADELLDAVEQRDEVGFPPHAAFLLYVENHDETRYVVECGDDAALAAAGAIFTLPGVPMIYGGQELGQRGRRDALAWDDAREEFREQYTRLVELQESVPALGAEGEITRIEHQADTDRAVAFERSLDGEAYVCVLNFGESTATVALDSRTVDPTDLVSGESLATAEGIAVDDVAVFRAR